MKDIKLITDKLEKGVKNIFESGKFEEYLKFMGKFHSYSANNTILIWMQKPEATLVAGYQMWMKKFERNVKKGEKAIQIIAPCQHKIKKTVEDQDGNIEEKEIQYITYRAVPVFDISQTEGKELPSLSKPLTSNVDGYTSVYKKLLEVSPAKIIMGEIDGSAKGFYNIARNEIVIKKDMAETQTIKTMIHEISHAMLHSKDGQEKDTDKRTKEVQAESIAYTVCTAIGIDTSDYSFGYIAGWSEGKELKELQESIEVIRNTACKIIESIEKR